MSMNQQSVGEIARSIAGATAVFHKYKLDFCCNGHLTLADACVKKKVEIDDVISDLQTLIDDQKQHLDRVETLQTDELIEHILARYHEVHRHQLPELIRLAERVEKVHKTHPDCPTGLASLLIEMQQELLSHMMKEEQILFPMIRAQQPQAVHPIEMMRYEHTLHGESLEVLEKLTHDITPPAGACNIWQALYIGLNTFKLDLMQHIHLENNELFMRVS